MRTALLADGILAAMKRPQRILLMILSSVAMTWLLLRLVPVTVAIGLGAVLLMVGLALAIWARHLLMGRYRMRRHDWHRAIGSFQRFERMMLTNRHGGWLQPLYLGIYTLDGVALARNNIGHALIRLGKLDEAEGWLRSALQRDPLYPVPYIHLGTIAAMNGQESAARRQFQKAVDLGYSPVTAQRLLARALASAKER